ncbi:MAG: hypothetical protein ACE5KM_16465 [Planctomycetaceae bacterium]
MKRQYWVAVAVAFPAACGLAADNNFRVANLPPSEAAVFDRAAEDAYARLSTWWFGKPHPALWRPVPLTVSVRANSSGGGATTFAMRRGEVFDWSMRVVGTRERILRDAIPHEVGHVVLYSHFRRPMGRCLDEGAASIGESSREHAAHRRRVATDVQRWRVLPFSTILDTTQYPRDASTTLRFYAQSHSLVEYLLHRKGRRTFLAFLRDRRKPSEKLRDFYGEGPSELQARWDVWFRERARRGVDCRSFGCPYHTAEKTGPPPVPPLSAERKSSGNRQPVIYAFTAKWCRACRPFKRDVEAGRFRGYRIVFVDPDSDRRRWNAITARMAAETGHRGDVSLPSWWVPGSGRLVVMRDGYSAPGLIQILERVIRGLIRIIHNPPRNADGTPPQGSRNTGDGTSAPSVVTPAEPAEDWTGATIALLVAERDVGVLRGRARQTLIGLSRGPLERKARELTGGKARLIVISERTQPRRYAATLQAAGLKPAAYDVVVLVPKQARGLVKGLVVRRIESIVAGKLADKPNIDVLFERSHPRNFAAVEAALKTEELPERGTASAANPARGVSGDSPRDLKQEIVFWLATIGLPMWLLERVTRNRRLARQVEKTWRQLRSSSRPSSRSSESAESAE